MEWTINIPFWINAGILGAGLGVGLAKREWFLFGMFAAASIMNVVGQFVALEF